MRLVVCMLAALASGAALADDSASGELRLRWDARDANAASVAAATPRRCVNPQRTRDDADAQRGARESALAARWYRRSGALDGYLFGRWGQHTQASLGAALAWVAGDELELHASARVLQRHDGWTMRSGPLLSSANP